jgi:hypothetical protein
MASNSSTGASSETSTTTDDKAFREEAGPESDEPQSSGTNNIDGTSKKTKPRRFLLLWLFIVAMNIVIATHYRDSCNTELVTAKEPLCIDSPERELDDPNTNSSLQG